MKLGTLVAGVILLVTPAIFAKDVPTYDKGTLLSMDSTTCGTAENGGKSVAGEILRRRVAWHKKTQELLCQEYVLTLRPHHLPYPPQGRQASRPPAYTMRRRFNSEYKKTNCFFAIRREIGRNANIRFFRCRCGRM